MGCGVFHLMAQAPVTKAQAQEALDAVVRCGGNKMHAAAMLGLPNGTLQNRVRRAKAFELLPSKGLEDSDNIEHVKLKLKRLELELKSAKSKALEGQQIRDSIIKLAGDVTELSIPKWTLPTAHKQSSPGVPTLMLSDLHWGEVVSPGQINHVNQYNISIAKRRLANVITGADMLLEILSPKRDYPGFVLILGGDMISGNIHEELQATNELPTMPTVLDLYGELVGVIAAIADRYGKVFIPCVTGNHGRDTRKTWNKDRHATSFDWLLYCFLAKHFSADKRITFFIPDGPDAYYRIFNHRYLLTHGDQFRGGDGLIGALGPITRGNHKKQSRNAQIDMSYDTMVIGHWHQEIFLRRLIVNSSLKGYDEYGFNNNFSFEPPSQQLWVTHPTIGMTWHMPVFADRHKQAIKTEWVTFARAA